MSPVDVEYQATPTFPESEDDNMMEIDEPSMRDVIQTTPTNKVLLFACELDYWYLKRIQLFSRSVKLIKIIL